MNSFKLFFVIILNFAVVYIAQEFKEADVVMLTGSVDAQYDSDIHTATDLEGNVYITGKFKNDAAVTSKHQNAEGDSLFITSVDIASNGDFDIFLAKYDIDGILLWAISFGGEGADIGKAVACNSTGDVIVTGTFQGTVNFDGILLTSTTSSNLFIASFNSEGKIKWATRGGGVTKLQVVEYGSGLAIDQFDNVYVSGAFFGSTEPPDYSIPGVGTIGDYEIKGAVQAYNSFVAKLTKNGKVEWVSCFGHYGLGAANAICTDIAGNAYITGVCSATFIVNGEVKKSNGLVDIYVAKFNTDGSFGWFKQLGSGESFNAADAMSYTDPFETGTGICSDALGNIYVTGQFADECKFGEFELESEGFSDIFIVKINGEGNVIWASSTGANYGDLATAIAFDGKGYIYITGINSDYGGLDIESTATFSSPGWKTVTERGIGFVERYNISDGKMDWGAGAGSWGSSLAANSKNEMHLVGTFANQVKFDDNTKLDIKKIIDSEYESGGLFSRGKKIETYIAGSAIYMVKIVDE
ncbi:MAG: hypothetical protein V1773_10380 [bacterium]